MRVKALSALVISIAALAACSGGGESTGDFPIEITDERVSEGKAVYETNCAVCHGQPGVSFPPLPAAPPHDQTGHTWHHPDRQLFEWVLDGVPLAQTMPVFRGRLTEEQVLGVLAYIKSTWPEDVRQWQREGSEQYEAQVRENP
jgi:mono/diheme cytochrome c family protein